MTRDRLLHVDGTVPTAELDEKHRSAELVFESHGSTDGDYHRCMNGESFVLWMRNRLFPAFDALYPGKRMILLLDNVKYHHHRGPLWIDPKTMDQDALAVTLAEHVPSITVMRGSGRFRQEITIPKRNFQCHAQSKPPGPTVTDLRRALTEWLVDHPQMTEVRRLMEERGGELLYSPPFQPEVQPIEMAWGTMKKSVARKHVRGRTIHETRSQTVDALRAITPGDIAGYFQHVDTVLEQWVKEDEELLQFGSFAAMIMSPGLAYRTDTSEQQVDNEYSDDEDDDQKQDED